MGSILGGLFNRQYTIGELMNIDASRQEKSKLCKVSFEKAYHELKKENLFDKFKSFFKGKSSINVYYLILKFSVISETGNKYKVFIKLNPDFSTNNWESNKVKIYCSCADFKYRSAYTLDGRGSLFKTTKISAALGSAVNEAPKKLGTTLLCKHSYAALVWLMNNYRSVMKSI